MKRSLFALTLYAVAMAYLEAAVVVYLRQLYYPDNPQRIFPLRFLAEIDLWIELGREAATVLMILAVALLAERSLPSRTLAAFAFVFGVWDLFYYVWLKVLIGWPASWLEWDVLFLIPWVWLGPWICPALISLLLIAWGGLVLLRPGPVVWRRTGVGLLVAGAVVDLASFLQPAAAVLAERGIEAMKHYEPAGFWWWLFVPGYVLMAWGLASLAAARRSS